MKLYYREYGRYSDQRPTLILLHGLLGSSVNWHGIARRLEARHHLLVPDLRNHGRSPHAPEMDYPSMAGDLLELLDEQGLDDALWVGHSMGGKAAMWLALARSERVAGLVVADIAPVAYDHDFGLILTAMEAVDPATLTSRQEADRILARYLDDPGLRQYLLQNLTREQGRWGWRVNLQALGAAMRAITGFSVPPGSSSYPGPTLFLHGDRSDYITPEHRPRIAALFPLARVRLIPGAGHWLYAEQPDAFVSALNRFIG